MREKGFMPAWKANLTNISAEIETKKFKEEQSKDFKVLFELDCRRRAAQKRIKWNKN